MVVWEIGKLGERIIELCVYKLRNIQDNPKISQDKQKKIKNYLIVK